MARLGDYVKIRTGKLDANASNENGQYPFFTCSVEPLKIDTYSYDCECVLVAGNGDLNVKYYNGKFDAYQRTYIITPNEGYNIDYIYFSLLIKLELLKKQSAGSQTKFLTMNSVADFLRDFL